VLPKLLLFTMTYSVCLETYLAFVVQQEEDDDDFFLPPPDLGLSLVDEVMSELSGGGGGEEDGDRKNATKPDHHEESKKSSDLKDLKDLVRYRRKKILFAVSWTKSRLLIQVENSSQDLLLKAYL